MSKHTPTPWKNIGVNVMTEDFGYYVAITQLMDGQRERVDSDVAVANAAFIVRAVNAHEQLVAALRGPDAEAPESIQPLSWLHSAIFELCQRGPSATDEDPEAFWEMVRELEAFEKAGRTALASVQP